MTENPILFQNLREVPIVCDALRELMKPEFDAAVNAAENKGINNAREEMARELLKDGTLSDEKIAAISKLTIERVKELKDELMTAV